MQTKTLFQPGEGGYSAFRIPSIIVLPSGRILAFCEGRMHGLQDWGTIHIVMKYSDDNGRTFSPLSLVTQNGEHTIGNPCPVYDRDTKLLHLLLNGNRADGGEALILKGQAPRTVLHVQSADEGRTWSSLQDISKETRKANWTWYAIGPCHGIQLRSGRLLLACNHAVQQPEKECSGPYTAHCIYSDDHGKSWQIGEDVTENTNECALAQLQDGRIYINMRSYHGKSCRAIAYSSDEGLSWQDFRLDRALPDPICQGSVLFCEVLWNRKHMLLCSNVPQTQERRNLAIHISEDSGQTWTRSLLLHEGPAAYSDMAQQSQHTLLCIYECGAEQPYEEIRLAFIEASDFEKNEL